MTRFLDILTGVNLHSRPKARIFRPVLASALVLWLTGVVCASVCGRHLQQSIDAQVAHTSAQASMPAGAMGDHACCRARRTRSASAQVSASISDQSEISCPIQRPLAEAARKFRATLSSAVAVPLIALAPPVLIQVSQPEVEIVRLPDRGGTHLRHCVFLI